MSTPVKRRYSSRLRAAQARETRRVVVAAAARLYVADGFGRTTIEAIAQAAGVSRKTVFSSVGGKVELLKLALDWAVVGDDEPVPLAGRPELDRMKAATDPDAILRGWVHIVTSIGSRVAEISGALTVAAGVDDDARTLWEHAQEQRHVGARAFIAHLAHHHGLRADLDRDEAADLAWVHSDPALHHRLVIQRGWSIDRFEQWLYETITFHVRGSGGATPGG